MGEAVEVDIASLFDEDMPITKNGVRFWDEGTAKYYAGVIEAASKHYNFSFDPSLPIKSYTPEAREFLMYGVTYPDFVKRHKDVKAPKKVSGGKFEGVVFHIMSRYKSNPSKAPATLKKYITRKPCPDCNNTRLGKIGREVTVGDKTIIDVVNFSL